MNHLRIALVVLTLACGLVSQTASPSAKGPKLSPVAAGVWGGDHISLAVTAEGADLEFDCAMGHIGTPLATDAQGKFKVKGTYRRVRPAAAQVDEGEGTAVVYEGSVKGNTMQLRIEIPGQEDMKFELLQGDEGRLTKCA